MIGLDSNVPVPLLTADEPKQLGGVQRLLRSHEGEHNVFFVNDMVLVELVWALRRLYNVSRGAALRAVSALLSAWSAPSSLASEKAMTSPTR